MAHRHHRSKSASRARIWSLEPRRTPFGRAQVWNVSVLRVSWTAHLLALLWMGVQGGEFTLNQQEFYIIYGMLIGATLLVEILEIALHSGDVLRPAVFTALQVLKVVLWMWYRIRSISCLARHWTRPETCSRSSALGGLTFLLCVPFVASATLVYAVAVLRQERIRQRSFTASQTDNSGEVEAHSGIKNDERLFKVNQADRLRMKASLAMHMLTWLDKSRSRIENAQTTADRLASWMSYALKHICVSIACIPFLALDRHLPGAPRTFQTYGILERESIRLASWSYLKVLVPRPELDRYGDIFPDEGLRISRQSRPTLQLQAMRRSATSSSWSTSQHSTRRLLGPRYLCFLTSNDEAPDDYNYTVMHTDDWKRLHPQDDPAYVFVSYTRRQFYTQIWNDPNRDVESLQSLRDAQERDRQLITRYAVEAARAAGVPAFWLDFECVKSEDDGLEEEGMEDVYRICDIVRAAHSLVIVLGPSLDQQMRRDESAVQAAHSQAWLAEWGSRLWTVPEALLAPSEHRIAVYSLRSSEVTRIAKRNFASRAYEDADAMQQLIEHFESSLLLTPLQFISLALECLQRRQTQKRFAGDVSYALQGLLRQRPRVEKTDSDFQAFARLSLANDSDMLLERLLCLSKDDVDAPWHDLSDTWSARLWDISPLCQVADIVDSRTVILGGSSGAMIDWHSLKPIEFEGSTSEQRFSWTYVHVTPGVIIFLVVAPLFYALILHTLLHDGRMDDNGQFAVNLALLGNIATFLWSICFATSLTIPALLLHLSDSDVLSSQARLFGIEGIADLQQVERRLLGAAHGRLQWSSMDAGGGDNNANTALRHFTLIDTLTMTATLFCAVDPPAIAVMGGRERGMVRALLCSYDWSVRTFVKETTMRMEANVLERMQRLERIRFRMAR